MIINTNTNASEFANALQHLPKKSAAQRERTEATQEKSELAVQSQNLKAATARIRDLDLAKETTDLVKSHILTESNVSIISQANSMPERALRLLQPE